MASLLTDCPLRTTAGYSAVLVSVQRDGKNSHRETMGTERTDTVFDNAFTAFAMDIPGYDFHLKHPPAPTMAVATPDNDVRVDVVLLVGEFFHPHDANRRRGVAPRRETPALANDEARPHLRRDQFRPRG